MRIEVEATYENSKLLETSDIRARNFKIFAWTNYFDWFRLAVFMSLDALMIYLAWFLAMNIVRLEYSPLIANTEGRHNWLLFIVVVNLLILALSGSYSSDYKLSKSSKLFISLTSAHILLLMAVHLYPSLRGIYGSFALTSWGLVLLLVISARYIANKCLVLLLQKRKFLRRKAAILGNREDIEACKKIIKDCQQFKLCYVRKLSGRETLSDWKKLLFDLRCCQINELIVCSLQQMSCPAILWRQLQAMGINLRVIDSRTDLLEHYYQVNFLHDLTTLSFKPSPMMGLDFWCKRGCDFLLTAIILMLLSPVLLGIAILIKLDSRGPVFFKQTRVGLQGRYFKMWKFRTMMANAELLQKDLEAKNEVKGGILFKIKDDPRITKIGKILRRYSLDELPQLFNVLKREMSLVGPRPLPVRDIEKMPSHYHLRHEVLPGITGLWQVNGRSDVSSETVFYWDQLYIQRWSLGLDLKILLKTILVVFHKKGAY